MLYRSVIDIAKLEMSFEEYTKRKRSDYSPIEDETGKEVGKIICDKHEKPRIVLNEDCPQDIVSLFSIQVSQKITPEVVIKE